MIDVRNHTAAALLAGLILSSGCSRTVVLEPAVAEPGEIAFGAESHERLFLGMPTKKTVATGIAATSPPEPRAQGDALWRVRRAGSRLQYCEAATQSCQDVWFGDKRKVRTGVMVIVDPVNRGGYLQVGSSNPGLEGAPGQIFFTGVVYADALQTPGHTHLIGMGCEHFHEEVVVPPRLEPAVLDANLRALYAA